MMLTKLAEWEEMERTKELRRVYGEEKKDEKNPQKKRLYKRRKDYSLHLKKEKHFIKECDIRTFRRKEKQTLHALLLKEKDDIDDIDIVFPIKKGSEGWGTW